MMYLIEKPIIYEQTIKKSRFIATLIPVQTKEAANQALLEVQKTYPDATHHPFAYIIGENASLIKTSDDKEPSQTAGIVIYEVLKRQELTNILAVVTRFYGGIKLGAGGLVRAYGSSVAKALDCSQKQAFITYQTLIIHCSYHHADLLMNYLQSYTLLHKVFADEVILSYQIPTFDFMTVKEQCVQLTNNQVRYEEKESKSSFF